MSGREGGARYGLIADVHSNLQALYAALDWLDDQAVDVVYCLGDVVGYGGDPAACVDLVRERCAGTVRGNHDAAVVDPALREWFNPHAREAIERQAGLLDDADREWLAGLPDTIELGEVAVTHAGFARPREFEYVVGAWEAAREMDALSSLGARWGFFGHTHLPTRFHRDPDGAISDPPMTEERAGLALDAPGRWLVNPGAVGQPRDGDPRAACAVFDAGSARLSYVRLSYDVAAAQAAIRREGMPDFEAERLAMGR